MTTPVGEVAVVAVGATNVGRIRATYDDAILTNAGRPARRVTYDRPRPIAKGEELGMFEMGSTVIVVFEPGRMVLSQDLLPDVPVRLGEPIGRPPGAKS